MMVSLKNLSSALLLLLSHVTAQKAGAKGAGPKGFPETGDGGGAAGGIFALLPGAKRPSQSKPGGMQTGKYAPSLGQMVLNDNSPGTGKYPAYYTVDSSLPNHTIYAPKSPPKDIKLPVVVWGNGGCVSDSTVAQNLLREIASHGIIVLANGLPSSKGGGAKQTKVQAMRDSLNWMEKGGAGGKFGTPDPTRVASMGHSCGGLESLAISYREKRITDTILINSSVLDDSQRYLLAEMKAPIALFIGGPKDVAYDNAEKDWKVYPKELKAIKANIDYGHMGPVGTKHGGLFGEAVVHYLKWRWENDETSKNMFLGKDATLTRKAAMLNGSTLMFSIASMIPVGKGSSSSERRQARSRWLMPHVKEPHPGSKFGALDIWREVPGAPTLVELRSYTPIFRSMFSHLWLVAFTGWAAGHGYVAQIRLGDKLVEGWNPYKDPQNKSPGLRITRKFKDNGPIPDGKWITLQKSEDIVCGAGKEGSNVPVAGTASVAAGSKVSFYWTNWKSDHPGPIMTYLAKCSGPCSSFKGDNGKIWVKIDEAGYDASKDPPWASKRLPTMNSTWTVTLPSKIANGEYLLRHEILGLQRTNKDPLQAQFYVNCHQITITGGGSQQLPAGVAFPGAYSPSDKGVSLSRPCRYHAD